MKSVIFSLLCVSSISMANSNLDYCMDRKKFVAPRFDVMEYRGWTYDAALSHYFNAKVGPAIEEFINQDQKNLPCVEPASDKSAE